MKSVEGLLEAAKRMAERLRGNDGADTLAAAKAMLVALCETRQFADVGILAEAIRRRDPKDYQVRRLYGQALIETGRATAAIDLLRVLRDDLPEGDPERAQAVGLIGRAFKEMFFDAVGTDGALADDALEHAIAAYRAPFERDSTANVWQGVGLLGMAIKGQQMGNATARAIDTPAIARGILATVDQTPAAEQSAWQRASAAVASLALEDWGQAHTRFQSFLDSKTVNAFQIGGTLRELDRTWNVAQHEEGRDLIAALQARLASEPDGSAMVSPDTVREEAARLQEDEATGRSQGRFEAVLGDAGPRSYRWWRNGMDRAQAVASVKDNVDGKRFGTAFLTTAEAFGIGGPDEQVVVTNHHVVSAAGEFSDDTGRHRTLRPDEATVTFEAASTTEYAVEKIIWSSPVDRHDVTLLKLRDRVENVVPLRSNATLPLLKDADTDGDVPRVFVIGYPRGGDLSFSFEDNEVLDHEGPDAGKPQIKGVCRVHYRAPTEPGSSGSPVFNSERWEVVAVHHKGGKNGMPRLNGLTGTYGANEAISIASIAAAAKTELGLAL